MLSTTWKTLLTKQLLLASTATTSFTSTGFSSSSTTIANNLSSLKKLNTNFLLMNHNSPIFRTKKTDNRVKEVSAKKKEMMKRQQQKEQAKKVEEKKKQQADLLAEKKNKTLPGGAGAGVGTGGLALKAKIPSLDKLYPKKKVKSVGISEIAKDNPFVTILSKKNGNLDLPNMEDVGYFNIKECKDISSLKELLITTKNRMDEIISILENDSTNKEKTDSLLKELISLKSKANSIFEICQLLPFENLKTLTKESKENLNNYFQNKYSLLLLPNKDKLSELKDNFEKKLREYLDFIENGNSLKIKGKLKIFELPNIIKLKRETEKKKRFTILNLEKDSELILTFVSEESLRLKVLDELNKKLNDNELINKLQQVIDAANSYSKYLGFNDYYDLKEFISLNSLQNTLQNKIIKNEEMMEVLTKLRDQLNVKSEIEKLSNLKIERLNNLQIKKSFYNNTKDTPESLKMFTPNYDLLQLSNLYYNVVKPNYLLQDINNNYLLPSIILNGLNNLFKDLFKLELIHVKMLPNETYSPLYVKKLLVVPVDNTVDNTAEKKAIGVIYLDLFDHRKEDLNLQESISNVATCHPIMENVTNSGLPSMVIQMHLQPYTLTVKNGLNFQQFKSLCGALGQTLFTMQYISKNGNSNLLNNNHFHLKRVLTHKIFERITQHEEFINKYIYHAGTKNSIPKVYTNELINLPNLEMSRVLQQLIYSIYEMEIFKPFDQTKHSALDILQNIETRICKPYTQLIPNLEFFSNQLFNILDLNNNENILKKVNLGKGSTLGLDLFLECCASHIWKLNVKNDDYNGLVNVMEKEMIGDLELNLERVLGGKVPDVSHLVKEIQK
ncbi:hypothetical protein ABK040_002715 [Willaertia magna]